MSKKPMTVKAGADSGIPVGGSPTLGGGRGR